MIVLSIIKWLVILAAIFFVLTFTVYFFNLDMKLTSALEPVLDKVYNKRKRDRRI